MLKRASWLLLVILLLSSCSTLESVRQTVKVQVQTAVVSSLYTVTPHPSNEPAETRLPPGGYNQPPGVIEPSMTATGTEEPASFEVTLTPRSLSEPTQQSAGSEDGKPYRPPNEGGIAIPLVGVLLLIFMALNKEGQVPEE